MLFTAQEIFLSFVKNKSFAALADQSARAEGYPELIAAYASSHSR
jgi:hypothetical protein